MHLIKKTNTENYYASIYIKKLYKRTQIIYLNNLK